MSSARCCARPPREHAAAGAGGTLVIEADESDASLLRYRVDTAVVTNVDLDHVGEAGGYQEIGNVARVLGVFAGASRQAIWLRAGGRVSCAAGGGFDRGRA